MITFPCVRKFSGWEMYCYFSGPNAEGVVVQSDQPGYPVGFVTVGHTYHNKAGYWATSWVEDDRDGEE